jgi:hypothetical protein
VPELADLRLSLDQFEDHVAEAFAWAAQGLELGDDVGLKPDQALALGSGLALVAD